MKTSDSAWHKQLSQLAEEAKAGKNPYWLHPFENNQTFCPYLVGDYAQVSEEIGKYVAVGLRTFILDIPPTQEELELNVVFQKTSAW